MHGHIPRPTQRTGHAASFLIDVRQSLTADPGILLQTNDLHRKQTHPAAIGPDADETEALLRRDGGTTAESTLVSCNATKSRSNPIETRARQSSPVVVAAIYR